MPGPVAGPAASYDHAANTLCSITNPFCPEARSAKWPDGALTKSATWTYENTVQLATPAAGGTSTVNNNSAIFLPNWNGFGGPCVTYNAGDSATFNTLPYGGGNYPVGVSRYRIVSWGLEITNIAPKLSASGLVRVRLASPLTGTTLATFATTTYLCDETFDLAASTEKRLFIIPKKIGLDANMFKDTTTYGSTAIASWLNPGWQAVVVSLTGAPTSTTMIQVRVVYNYEVVYAEGEASAYFQTPSPASNVAVQQGTSSVLNSVGNFFEGAAERLDAVFKSKALKYVASAGTLLLTKNPRAAAATFQITNGPN